MARFTAYSKKQIPDDNDTLLIYDNDANPDTLKQIDLKSLFETYKSTSLGGQNRTVKSAIDALDNRIDFLEGNDPYLNANGILILSNGRGG